MPGVRAGEVSEDWFEDFFGVREGGWDEVRSQFTFGAGLLIQKSTGKMWSVANFKMPSLEELTDQLEKAVEKAPGGFWCAGELTFENIVGDTHELHLDPENAGAVFQVASLFNCLETVDGLQPQAGVTHYARYGTQGPACAVACPAATVYRNYFWDQTGQAESHQVDCLEKLGKVVDNKAHGYWAMRNGYCLPRVPGSIAMLSNLIANDDKMEDKAREAIQVGIHWDTEVWGGSHHVCQVFCSALPVGPTLTKSSEWLAFAMVVLEAAYDATLTAAACLAAERGERVKVYLTAVGAGLMGNRPSWIAGAMERALSKHAKDPLDVHLVHFGILPGHSHDFMKLEVGRKPESPVPRPPRGIPPTPSMGLTMHLAKQGLEKPLDSVSKQIRAVFGEHDINGDGVLDRFEFAQLLAGINEEFFTPRVIDLLLASADADGDGLIHYGDFVSWIIEEDSDIVSKIMPPGKK